MCGILFHRAHRKTAHESSYAHGRQRHRGPDESKTYTDGVFEYCFHRLSINGVSSGGQPMFVNGNTVMCNGEIYNYKELADEYGIELVTGSDCEIIGYIDEDNVRALDGDFAFVLVKDGVPLIARDPVGVRPLYYGFDVDGHIAVSSEIKSFRSDVSRISHFPPGHYYHRGNFVNYNPIVHREPSPASASAYDESKLRSTFIDGVKKRLMSDRDIGFFLSGGLDSSIVAAVGKELLGDVRTFSVGLKDPYFSPDIEHANLMAEFIRSNHTNVYFTPEEGIGAIKEVIWHLETYDCTTVRASVPMFLLSKYVAENTDIKVILSGEGADELFGGYIYFHDAPSDAAFREESARLMKNVHQFDVLRADRCTAGNGLELRVPFFDKAFVNEVIDMSTTLKRTIPEKQTLRDAFRAYIPEEIYKRQKNGMSDAVGYTWVDAVKNYANAVVTNEEFESMAERYTHNTPLTKEEYLYRKVYHDIFGKVDACSSVWRPRWTNCADPSARCLKQFVS